MASSAQSAITGVQLKIAGRNGLVDKYFYFAMSLFFAAIVVWGFSQTIDQNLFHLPFPGLSCCGFMPLHSPDG